MFLVCNFTVGGNGHADPLKPKCLDRVPFCGKCFAAAAHVQCEPRRPNTLATLWLVVCYIGNLDSYVQFSGSRFPCRERDKECSPLSRCVGALCIFGPAYALSVRSVGALCVSLNSVATKTPDEKYSSIQAGQSARRCIAIATLRHTSSGAFS